MGNEYDAYDSFQPPVSMVRLCYDDRKAPKRSPKRRSRLHSTCEKSMRPPSQDIRVLVVDDSPVSRKLLEHTLNEAPYHLVFAKDGSDALRLFGERPPDLVIADWELPDIPGPELCRIVRTKFDGAYTYMMLVTSNSDKKSIAEGLAAGADDYLTKPFDAEELRARVGVGRRVIEMHREIEAKTKALALDARTDALTGLPNRRAVEEWAVKQVSGAVRHGYPIWVVLADLDSYKPATDLFGRAAGDAMLQAFGEILKKNTRVSDMCGHMGGDQFTLVISHVTSENMDLVLNRLREKIASHDFTYQGVALPLFVNLGMAGSEGGERLELRTMLQQADAALLEAKRTTHASLAETARDIAKVNRRAT
jgi:diguanylate cyclase (GGDEF)-like protein